MYIYRSSFRLETNSELRYTFIRENVTWVTERLCYLFRVCASVMQLRRHHTLIAISDVTIATRGNEGQHDATDDCIRDVYVCWDEDRRSFADESLQECSVIGEKIILFMSLFIRYINLIPEVLKNRQHYSLTYRRVSALLKVKLRYRLLTSVEKVSYGKTRVYISPYKEFKNQSKKPQILPVPTTIQYTQIISIQVPDHDRD